MDNLIYIVGGISVAAIVSIGLRRRFRNYDSMLQPILQRHGFDIVSSKRPGLFRSGPFPKIASKMGGRQTAVLGVRGDYWVHRIVQFRSSDGASHDAWARLRFEAFKLEEVEWRPPLEEFAATS